MTLLQGTYYFTDLDDADDSQYGIFSVKPLRPTDFTTLLNIAYMSATRPLHFGGRVGRHNQRNDSRQQQQHNAAASHPLLARRWLPPNTQHHYTAACVSAGSGSHHGATVWWWCVQMLPCPCCQECGGGCVSVVPVVVRGRGYLAWPGPPSAALAINNMMQPSLT